MKNEKSTKSNRRNFIKKTSLAYVGALTLGQVNAQDDSFVTTQLQNLPKDLTILFQGDSITDAGRSKEGYYANHTWGGMGAGYAMYSVGALLGRNLNSNMRCYNRGISGNKVHQLASRWEEDCMQIRPDVLSILIGVNDFWHTIDLGYKATVKTYEDDFKKLLDRTLKELPDLKLMICEPFVVKGGSAIKAEAWFPAFMAYQKAAKNIASEYKANWVPFQKTFDDALKSSTVEALCPDGVHPTLGGSYLMAQEWLGVFEKMMK